jgi:hypothetical protein
LGHRIDDKAPAEKGADGGSEDQRLPVVDDGSGRLMALAQNPWGCQLNQMEAGGVR